MRLLLVALLLAAGCASTPIRQADLSRLAAADASVLEGCHACLVSARDTYEQLAVGRARPLIVGRLFEVNVLIGLREAELAMTPTDAFVRAEAVVPELPSTAGAPLLLSLARLIPRDDAGTPRAARRARLPEVREFIRVRVDPAGLLQAAEVSLPFRQYLLAGWNCLALSIGTAAGSPLVSDAPDSVEASPLVTYRRATCPTVDVERLEGVLADVPGFIEAGYISARQPTLAVTAEHVQNQRTWFSAAREAFPSSASVTYSLGTLNQTMGDCRAAVEHYDATLSLEPRHEDAALQRVICLGYERRHENAINAASRIIDEAYDNQGEAYYWRAWNHHRMRQLDQARADIDQALERRVNSRILTLGGVIKYDQNELVPAERDLGAAVQMDPTQCVARWYLGLVAFARELWLATGEDFEAAAGCYRQAAEQTTRDLDAMRAADLDPAFKASQILGFEAAIQDDRSQEQASYLNAANGFVRAGNPARAAEVIARIPDESTYATGARQVREYLDALAAAPP